MAGNLTDEQDKQLLYELQAGRKLAAVKLYKEWTGASLLESKNYVESLPEGQGGDTASVFGSNLQEHQIDQVLEAIQRGNKLEAVKLYKAHSGSSLMDSKKFIEQLMSELGIEDRGGCAAGLLLAAIAAGAAITIA